MTYLDHNATSPMREGVRIVVEQALARCGNPSSIHASGRAARALVEDARIKVAGLAGAPPQNVIFTSGGTEANAMALWGALAGALDARPQGTSRVTRLFVSAIEHSSVLANASAMTERFAGVRLSQLPVQSSGVVDLDALRDGLREGKGQALVALMAANNETGVIQPVAEAASIIKEAGALLMVDAVQAAGKTAIPQADYVTLSAHKIGGPQGVGALILKDAAPFSPLILGGGQERGARPGTENVPGIAGFGAAAEAVQAEPYSSVLRDQFEAGLKQIAHPVIIFGAESPRLPNTSNFSLPGISAETALMALDLDGVMISSGAACSSGKVKRSHVLDAMGINNDTAGAALRASFGWNSTAADVEAALDSILNLVARRRAAA